MKEYKVTALYENAKSQILDLAKTFLLAIRDELVRKEGNPAEPGQSTFTIDLFSYPTYITLPVNVHDTYTEEEYEESWTVNAIRYGDDGIAITMEEGALLLNSFDIDKIAKVCRYLEDILENIKNGKGGSVHLNN